MSSKPKNRDKKGIDPEWAKKLPRRVIAAVNGAVGGDGHSIFNGQMFRELGLSEEVVEHYTEKHFSGLLPKEMISTEEGPVPSLVGIYGSRLVQGMALSLGVEWRSALGRGREARNVSAAISQWLAETDPGEVIPE